MQTPYSTYLLSKYVSNKMELKTCECCGITYSTNIKRIRCSKKCSKIMKYRRAKENKKSKLDV